MQYKYIIGIDSGTNTGIAVWNKQEKKFERIDTVKIHTAMDIVKEYATEDCTLIIVEDARQAVYGRENDKHRLRGAGSICRDAKIWEDFLKDNGFNYQMKRPNKRITKIPVEIFKKTTGWNHRTSNHGRDAALMIYKY